MPNRNRILNGITAARGVDSSAEQAGASAASQYT